MVRLGVNITDSGLTCTLTYNTSIVVYDRPAQICNSSHRCYGSRLYLGGDEFSGPVFGGEAVVFVLAVALHHEVELQGYWH